MNTYSAVYFGILGGLVVCVLLWDLLYGPDRRILRSREFCYRHLSIPPMDDDAFSSYPLFQERGVPRDFILKLRRDIADDYLDFPVDRLHPDMRWDEIPLDKSPWWRDLEGLDDYITELTDAKPFEFGDQTVAEVFVRLYELHASKLGLQLAGV